MCGIAGIIYRSPSLYGNLTRDLLALISPLESRGPDSSGIALYGNETEPDQFKLVLRGESDWLGLLEWLKQFAEVDVADPITEGRRIVLFQDGGQRFDLRQFKRALQEDFPDLYFSSAGQKLEIYKAVGGVANLTRCSELSGFWGSHGIAHTRMATESVVDIDHCHPFTSSFDLSIVHNGQISNYYKLRFQLERSGMVFETHNDSEAIAHYVNDQFLRGHDLETALYNLLRDIDGTYTFLVATPDKVGLVRDKYAAKPAVIYESPEMVAIASEYRALLTLPDFDPSASIREPDAAEVNVWTVGAGERSLQFAH